MNLEQEQPKPENEAPPAAAPAEGTPAPEAAPADPAAPAAEEKDPAEGTPPPVAFKPDFKLKIMDQDKEIPEPFRALMKDEKSAKEIREIFEKSYGIEFMKPKYETLKTTHAELQTQHETLNNQIADLRSDYARGDLDSFFQKLNIPTEKILQYALQKVQYQELPPDQKQLLDEKRAAELDRQRLARENEQISKSYEQQMLQARNTMLDAELARSDIKSMAEAYDARVGEPGAFRREVVLRGQAAWQNRKVDLLPGQAIEEAVRILGLRAAPASATAPSPTAPASAAVPPQTASIPNVTGAKSVSPVKKLPESIADLRKMAAEM